MQAKVQSARPSRPEYASIAVMTGMALLSTSLLRAEPTNAASIKSEADYIMNEATNTGNNSEKLSGEMADESLIAARMYKSIGATNEWRRASEQAARLYSLDLIDATPVEKAKSLYLELGEPERATALQVKSDSAIKQLKKDATLLSITLAFAGILFLTIRHGKDKSQKRESNVE